MIELHYIKLLEKKQEEIDELRSILFMLLKSDKINKEDKQLIINTFFKDDKE